MQPFTYTSASLIFISSKENLWQRHVLIILEHDFFLAKYATFYHVVSREDLYFIFLWDILFVVLLLDVLIYFRIYLSYNIWKHYFCMTVFSIFSFIFKISASYDICLVVLTLTIIFIFFMVKMDMLRWYNMGCLPAQKKNISLSSG